MFKRKNPSLLKFFLLAVLIFPLVFISLSFWDSLNVGAGDSPPFGSNILLYTLFLGVIFDIFLVLAFFYEPQPLPRRSNKNFYDRSETIIVFYFVWCFVIIVFGTIPLLILGELIKNLSPDTLMALYIGSCIVLPLIPPLILFRDFKILWNRLVHKLHGTHPEKPKKFISYYHERKKAETMEDTVSPEPPSFPSHCPSCQNPLPTRSYFCPHCGEQLQPP